MILPGIGAALIGSSSVTPSLRGSVQVSSQTSGGTFAPTIPTHQAGDVILVFVGHIGSSTVSPSSGWTEAAQTTTATPPRPNGLVLYYRTATGSSHTITITNSNASDAIAHVYVLQNAKGDVTAQAIGVGNDPTSATAAWGADQNLWYVANACSSVPTVSPTGFSDTVQTTSGNVTLTTLDKPDSSATLDPSAFNGSGSNTCLTAVVRPA